MWGNTSPIDIQHLPLNFFCLQYSSHWNIAARLSILRISQCSLSCCIARSWCSWLLTDDMNNKKGRVNKSGCRWGKMRWGSWSAEYIMTKHFDRQTQNKVPKSLSPDSFVKWVRTLLILYVCAREHFATVCLVVLCICICVEGLEAMPFFFCKFDNLYILLWLWVVLAPLANGIVSWCGSGIWKGNVRRVCQNNMSKDELTNTSSQWMVEMVSCSIVSDGSVGWGYDGRWGRSWSWNEDGLGVEMPGSSLQASTSWWRGLLLASMRHAWSRRASASFPQALLIFWCSTVSFWSVSTRLLLRPSTLAF